MIEKRKTPWWAFIIGLFILLILAYFGCGLLKLDGVTINNYQQKLLYIFTHPFRNWWTKKTPAFMSVVFVAWIMFIAYYLDQNRNYHFGVENGSEQWADVNKLSKTLRDSKNEKNNTYLSERIAVSNNALSNMNMLVIGGSGSYKTTSVLTPNLLLAGMTNVILDIKGDLLRKHGNYLKEHGVKVKSFNLINPEESDRYNPMQYLQKETDVIRLITNMQASVKPPDAQKGDPFWDDGVALYLQAMFFHEWLTAKEENRKPTLNNILKLVNMESKHVGDGEEDDKTELQLEMDQTCRIAWR